MKVEIFPAKIGDSFLISYGRDYEKHILIDGGYKETYDDFLKKRLKEINGLNQRLELVIVTHIDRDHIGGILSLIRENGHSTKTNIINIKEIWHNSYRHLKKENTEEIIQGSPEEMILDDMISAGAAVFSAGEGNISGYDGSMLASYIYENEYNWNSQFNNKAVLGEDLKEIYLEEDLKLILLSPYETSLNNLISEWEENLKGRKLNFKFGEGKKFDDAFEFYHMREEEELSEPSYCSYDEVTQWDKVSFPTVDNSKANASSIALIIEYQGKKNLFLGDANPNIIMESLTKLKEEKGYDLMFETVKLSHHGSLKSTSKELINLIDSKNWIFSGTGKKKKPSEELAKLILKKKKNYFKQMIFNYEIDWVTSLKKEEIKKEYNYEIIEGNENASTLLILERGGK